MTRSRIVRIGDAQGVRIPKPLLEEAGLGDEVELHAEAGRIVIESVRRQKGWAESARDMLRRGKDALLHPGAVPFDSDDW